MVDQAARDKWDRKHAESPQAPPVPARVLTEHARLLPKSGIALDLACGQGGNALFLARRGLVVHAWDISGIAIDELQRLAMAENLEIQTSIRDVSEHPPGPGSFDVICVSFYLERTIIRQIIEALKPQGLLFYQTFIHEKVTDEGPGNPSYRLGPNELLELFAPLHVLAYREEGRTGDLQQGLRDTAWLVGQKRKGGSA
ncbi:MAG: methyltransferase domain-containing protein [Proteobacteria bacterium]|nr:methyltransferase domain-containing protein [Pseudomonadota bacterium]